MRTRPSAPTALVVPAVFAASLAWSNVAQAGPNDNAHTKPWTLNLGLGPNINLENGFALGKAGADFQYHFKRGDVGPALGAQSNFVFRQNLFGMEIGPIFLWDFRVFADPNAKLYLAPVVSSGYAFVTFPGVTNATAHAWYMTVGGQFKAVFKDWVGIYVRPADFEVWAGNGGATGFWSMLMGVTFNFG